jgi:hypothetical protein
VHCFVSRPSGVFHLQRRHVFSLPSILQCSTVAEPDPVVENIMLLKGEKGSVIVDLHADDTSPTGVRFDQPHWKRHLQSLKPVGLACMLNQPLSISSAASSAPAPAMVAGTAANDAPTNTGTARSPDAVPDAGAAAAAAAATQSGVQTESRKPKRKPKRTKSSAPAAQPQVSASSSADGPPVVNESAVSAGSRLRRLVPRMLQRSGKGEAASSSMSVAELRPAETSPQSAPSPAPAVSTVLLNARAGSVLARMLGNNSTGEAPHTRIPPHEQGDERCADLTFLQLPPQGNVVDAGAVTSKPPFISRVQMHLFSSSLRPVSPAVSTSGPPLPLGGVAPLRAPSPSTHPPLIQQRSLPATPVLLTGAAERAPSGLRVSFHTDAESVSSGAEAPTSIPPTAKRPFSLSRMLPSSLRQSLHSRRWGSTAAVSSPRADSPLLRADSPSMQPSSSIHPATAAALGDSNEPACPIGPATTIPRASHSSDASTSSESTESSDSSSEALSEYSFGAGDGSEDTDDSEASGSDDAASDSSIDSARLERRQHRQARLARRIPTASGDADSESESDSSGEEDSESGTGALPAPMPSQAESNRVRETPADEKSTEAQGGGSRGPNVSSPLPSVSSSRRLQHDAAALLPSRSLSSRSSRRRSIDTSELYKAALRGTGRIAVDIDADYQSPGPEFRQHSKIAGDLLASASPSSLNRFWLSRDDEERLGASHASSDALGALTSPRPPRLLYREHSQTTALGEPSAKLTDSIDMTLSPRFDTDLPLPIASFMGRVSAHVSSPVDEFSGSADAGEASVPEAANLGSDFHHASIVVAVPRIRGEEQWTAPHADVISPQHDAGSEALLEMYPDAGVEAVPDRNDSSSLHLLRESRRDAAAGALPVTDRQKGAIPKKGRHIRGPMAFVDVDALIQV